MHRKYWELCYICQALDERGLLRLNSKGLVFAVGEEQLPAVFASRGCSIVATDLDANDAHASGWVESNQHAASLEKLNKDGLCDPATFNERVTFRPVDMNHIPADLMQGEFDFVWSACSFEHLGSLRRGHDFVLNSLKCLRPGGVAVHTSEYNCSSNWRTLESEGLSIYRKRDIQALARDIRATGCRIEIDYRQGTLPYDKHVDLPPYSWDKHIKLLLEGFVTTSIGLIIEKPS
jgi:SAM-dependent methyltransferase